MFANTRKACNEVLRVLLRLDFIDTSGVWLYNVYWNQILFTFCQPACAKNSRSLYFSAFFWVEQI
jgi:hypothetical protein